VIAGTNATMEKMLSERGKILVIFENFKFRNCGSTEKAVVCIYYKHRWGPPLGSIKLQRRSSLNLLGEAGTDFQISK
jgi:hypothetical protein